MSRWWETVSLTKFLTYAFFFIMNIALTPTLEAFAQEKVRSGCYSDASEVVREAMRLLMERDLQNERLREEVAKGFQQLEHDQFTSVEDREHFLSLARARR